MRNVLVALLPVGLILLSSEYLWRKKIIRDEVARKFIHILAGVWIAFWPVYLPFDGIIVLGAVAATLLIYSHVTRLFGAIYAVRRKTYGDIFFAFAIITSAVLSEAAWIFSVSILLMALADGTAAVAGRYWGMGNTYHPFKMSIVEKSVAGTTVFILAALVGVGIGWWMGGDTVIKDHAVIMFVVFPLSAAFLENVTPYGLDNLINPLFATLLLNSIS